VQAIMCTYARVKAPTRVLVVDDSHTVRQIGLDTPQQFKQMQPRSSSS